MNRRRFLKYGLFGGILLAAGGIGLAAWPTRRTYQPRRPLAVFTPREFSVIAAIAARTVGAPNADPVEIAHNVDTALTSQPIDNQRETRQLVGLFENALTGLLLDGQFGPFTTLSPEKQDAVLRSWCFSTLPVRRTGYTALRKLTQAGHYCDPKCWPQVGYPGPPTISQLPPT